MNGFARHPIITSFCWRSFKYFFFIHLLKLSLELVLSQKLVFDFKESILGDFKLTPNKLKHFFVILRF